jgi:tetratricopeptide (TPR) repeat protein
MDKKPFIALQKIKSELRITPNDARLLFYKGLILTKINKKKEAILTFTNLINKHPSLPEPYNNLAVLYAGFGKLELAKETLEKAILTNKSYSTAHINLGDIYTQMATNAYNKALEIDNKNKIAHNKLKLITELFNYQPSTEEKKITISKLENHQQTNKIPINKTEVLKEIKETMKIWESAWENRDLEVYLNTYSINFKYPNNMLKKQWEQYRADRILNKKEIIITISKINYKINKDVVTASFIQNYKSNNYNNSSQKTLVLQNESNHWVIIEEFTGKKSK